jgi:hypothetical protein
MLDLSLRRCDVVSFFRLSDNEDRVSRIEDPISLVDRFGLSGPY